MAYLYIDALGTWDALGFNQVFADSTVEAGPDGRPAVKATFPSSGARLITGLSETTIYAKSRVRPVSNANPSAAVNKRTLQLTNGSGVVVASIQTRTTDLGVMTFRCMRNGDVDQVGSLFTITNGAEYVIELRAVVSATVGEVEMRVDGVSRASATALNTGTSPILHVQCMAGNSPSQNLNGESGYIWHQDMAVRNDNWVGLGRVRHFLPGGAGVYTDGTKVGSVDTKWGSLAQFPYSSTDRVTLGTADATRAETVTVAGIATTVAGNATIGAAQLGAVLARDATAGARTHQTRLRLAGSNADKTHTLTTGYAFFRSDITTPTYNDLLNVEIGAVRSGGTGGEATEIADVLLSVAYDGEFNGQTEALAPDAILASANFTSPDVADIDESPASPDGSWLVATTAIATTDVRVSFPSPTGTPRVGANLQTFQAYLRKTTGTPDPTVDIELWESGGFVATLLNDVSITSTTGQLVQATWDATLLSGALGANVEVRIVSSPGIG